MKKLEAATKKAARERVTAQGKKVEGVRHIHPRAYIIAKPAPGCAVVAVPWMDGEPQCRRKAFDSQITTRNFDTDLQMGDWCSVAYVVTEHISEPVAVKPVKA